LCYIQLRRSGLCVAGGLLQDPTVQAAVAELKAAKDALGQLELLISAYTAPVGAVSGEQAAGSQQAGQHGYGVLAGLRQREASKAEPNSV
jgi:hypothetical protein